MNPRRLIAAFLAAIMLVVAFPAAPASAGSSYISRTTGKAADAYWTQIDGTRYGRSPNGNVHLGWLYTYETSKGVGDVFLYIDDFDCRPGQEPWGGHNGGNGCDYKGSRFGEGFGLAFTVDRKLNAARLVGRVTLYGGDPHGGGGGVVGSPAIDMSWTGFGDLAKTTSTFRWNEGGSSYTDRYRATYRQATLSGKIGTMSFAPDLSGGSISQFSSFSKGRTR